MVISELPDLSRRTTVFSLLLRAASVQPQNGILFRNSKVQSGFEKISYANLLDVSKVRLLYTTELDARD
jgi:hypothetical protein